MTLGVGAAGAFGGSPSPALSSTGKNSRGLIGKWDLWTAAIEGPSPACTRSRVKSACKYMSRSTLGDVCSKELRKKKTGIERCFFF